MLNTVTCHAMRRVPELDLMPMWMSLTVAQLICK